MYNYTSKEYASNALIHCEITGPDIKFSWWVKPKGWTGPDIKFSWWVKPKGWTGPDVR